MIIEFFKVFAMEKYQTDKKSRETYMMNPYIEQFVIQLLMQTNSFHLLYSLYFPDYLKPI